VIGEQRVVLRQRRDLSQIIEATFSIYGRSPGPLLTIAAVVVPLGIASAVFQKDLDNSAGVAVIVVALALLQAAVNLLAAGALIAALADIDAGRTPEFSRAYDVAFDRFWTLLGAMLRAAFHVMLFAITIVGIPWAIQRAVRWLFVEQAVILDHTSSRAALSYSADAVLGQWWRTLGVWTVISIIAGAPAFIISLLFRLAPIALSAAANGVVNAALLPFAVTASTLLYFDLQMRKESDVTTSPA